MDPDTLVTLITFLFFAGFTVVVLIGYLLEQRRIRKSRSISNNDTKEKNLATGTTQYEVHWRMALNRDTRQIERDR
jgi:hypothetical protein